MGVRQDFEKRIGRKEQEIADLEGKIRDARSYIQALEDAMKIVPKDVLEQESDGRTLRPGSSMAKARDAVRKAGKPIYILDILKAIGKPQDKKNRISLAGSLSAYAKRKEIFTKPAPNTFGLLEFEKAPEAEIPESFGKV
jgi:hypothetical protein